MLARPGDPFRLFVYGTLMRGGCRHSLLGDQRFLGTARTAPAYGLFHLGDYPGMVEHDQGQAVAGELYEVSAHSLPALDAAEGAPSWFSLGPVALEDDTAAWTYYFRRGTAGRPLCPEGRWVNHERP